MKGPQISEQAYQFDYTQRPQWLRAVVGLISTGSLMMGVGSTTKAEAKIVILTGFAGLTAGACSTAIREFERGQMKRDTEDGKKSPNPYEEAAASAISFSVGAMVPISAAAFIEDHKVRLAVLIGVTTLALFIFGALGGILGKSPLLRSSLRVLIGGWMAVALTIGSTKLVEMSEW